MSMGGDVGERESRGGGILLVLAFVLLVLLGIALFSQSRRSGWLTHEASALIAGARTRDLALSVVEEAMARLRPQLNRDASAARRIFLGPVAGEEDIPPRDLTAQVRLESAATLLGLSAFRGYSIDEFGVTLLDRRQVDVEPDFYVGTLMIRATVSSKGGFGRKVTRRAEVVYPFTEALVSVPRPFAFHGIFLADMSYLTDTTKVNAIRGKLLDYLHELREIVAELKEDAPSTVKGEYESFGSTLYTPDSESRVPTFPSRNERAAFYGLGNGATMRLDLLDLAGYLEGVQDRVENMLPHLQDLYARVKGSSNEDVHREYVEAARKFWKEVDDGLWTIWAYCVTCKIVYEDDPYFKTIERNRWKLTSAYFNRRVQQWVVPQAGRDVNEAWAEYMRIHPILGGNIRIVNKDGPLVLKGEIRGRCRLIVGPGGVTLEDFNKRDDPDDLVTVVCLGGPVTIRGEVHCALVLGEDASGGEASGPSSLTMEDDSRLVGMLVACELPASLELKGILEANDKYYSGQSVPGEGERFNVSQFFIGVNPTPIYSKVE